MAGPVWMGEWPIAYPHASRTWTVRSRSGRAWGALAPETAVVERVEPGADQRLPGLALALQSGSLVGYRVERRAVVRTHRGYVKVVRPSRVRRMVEGHRRLAEADAPFRVPAVLQAGDDGRVELETLPGCSVHDLFRSPGPDVPIPIDRIADALVGLHRQESTGDQPPADHAASWASTVARAQPDLRDRLSRLADRLPTLPMADPTLIHGDLHDKNILVSDGPVGLIDLDGLRTGIAEDELANLGVHLQLRCLQSGRPIEVGRALATRLYGRYGQSRAISRPRIDAAERHVWFRLACLYHFREASRPLVPALLGLAVNER